MKFFRKRTQGPDGETPLAAATPPSTPLEAEHPAPTDIWSDPAVVQIYDVVGGTPILKHRDLEGPDELLAELFITHDSVIDEASTIPEMRTACLGGISAVERFTEAVPEGWGKLITYRVANVARGLSAYRQSADAGPLLEWAVDTIEGRGWVTDGRRTALGEQHHECVGLLVRLGSTGGDRGDYARSLAVDWYVNIAVPRMLGTEPDAATVAAHDSPDRLVLGTQGETGAPSSKTIAGKSFAEMFDAAYADLCGPDSPCVLGDIDSPVDRLGWYKSWEGWPPHVALNAAMDWFEAESLDYAYRERGRDPVHARAGQLQRSSQEYGTDKTVLAVYTRLGESLFDKGELASAETFPALVVLASHARNIGHRRSDEWTGHVREMVRRSPGVEADLPADIKELLPS